MSTLDSSSHSPDAPPHVAEAPDAGVPTSAPVNTRLRRRRNMLDHAGERWRPPIFSAATTPAARLTAWLRRLIDLQAGSIWRDLSDELKRPHGLVLDVGCGAQPYRRLVHPTDRYVGIDTAAAADHFGYEVPDTVYYTGDTWPVGDGEADLVLCTETLEHVADPDAFLAEAARATRSGGTLLLTVPFAARWHYIPHDYWRFTPSALRLLLERHGFADVAVYARGNHVTVACYKVMALILPLLMPSGHGRVAGALMRVVGLILSPLLLALAVIGNFSLLGRGGDDCLGYTAIATRAVPAASANHA